MKEWIAKILLLSCFLAPCLSQAQTYVPPKVVPWSYVRVAQPPAECGNLFVGTFSLILISTYESANMIIDSEGDLLWYQSDLDRKLGFTLQPNGMMSWYQKGQYYLMDSTFNIVDSLSCANSRRTDDHELHVGKNGNYFILCTKDTAADLSGVQTTLGGWGSPMGSARFAVIQELDPSGNLIKEWDGTPYWQPTDILPQYFETIWFMDLMHPNSIDTDTNGQVLISNRHVSEVTCIDWATGQIKWRMGGAHNEFTFANGDPGNNTQHDARFRPGGISLFDNGTYHQPAISRAIDYDLDTANRIATPVWAYQHPTQISTAMGNYQRLPSGDALINWGLGNITPFDQVSVVRPDSTLKFKMRLSGQMIAYRSFCEEIPFEVNRPRILCESTGDSVRLSVTGSHAAFQWSTGDTTSTVMIADTGKFQVFVPRGIGWIGSEPLHVQDLNQPCAGVGIAPPISRSRKQLGIWDLLGRPVSHPRSGQIYLRRYDDGTTENLSCSKESETSSI